MLKNFIAILSLTAASLVSYSQTALNIPPALSGTTFSLNVQSGTSSFYASTSTPTFGINGIWMSPTIVVNAGDSVTLNVNNGLSVKTTMHWHGLHVAPQNDGGPHQEINAGATWSPSFKIRNNAGTFWYHPHGAGQTDPQVSKGLAGMFIIHDAAELALPIPHTYGVDDVPVIVQSKAFDALQQIAIATNMDTAIFVNGTLNPYYDAPAQVIRFRLLNGSSLRSYYFGFSNGQTIYQIGTDGGLLDTPITSTRLLLSPGERAEILVNFSGMVGQTIYLKSYSSEMPTGIYGADTLGSGIDTVHEYEENPLNGADYTILKVTIVSPTASPVSTIPVSLVPLSPYDIAAVTKTRAIVLDTLRLLPGDLPNRAEGPFGLNYETFDMDSVNEVVYLNTTEVWTLINHTLVAHPFHIHDVQFNVVEEHGIPIPAKNRGWKDVVLVMPGDSVKFLTKFEDFTDPMVPYMYHCHLLHHEDDGMMGSFIVIDSASLGSDIPKAEKGMTVAVFPNPADEYFDVKFTSITKPVSVSVTDVLGKVMYEQNTNGDFRVDISKWPKSVYIVLIQNGNERIYSKITTY